MNRFLRLLALLSIGPALLSAHLASAAEQLEVAATPVPHAQILEFIKPALAKEGVKLKVRTFTDYVQPNLQVAQKRLDANYFQTEPYLDEFNSARGTDLVTVVGVHVEPFGAYSRKIKAIGDLAEGAQVALPSDASNTGRALLLLQKNGLIKLKAGANILATPRILPKIRKNCAFVNWNRPPCPGCWIRWIWP